MFHIEIEEKCGWIIGGGVKGGGGQRAWWAITSEYSCACTVNDALMDVAEKKAGRTDSKQFMARHLLTDKNI